MMRAIALCAALVAGPALAQEISVETLDSESGPQIVIVPQQPQVFSLQRDLGTATSEIDTTAIGGEGALLRGLDKLNGEAVDLELDNGYSVAFGDLRVDLAECRYPEDNATGEAYAFLTIYDGVEAVDPLFQGWMIASSPALSALDHARFDIWVLRCKTPEPEETESE